MNHICHGLKTEQLCLLPLGVTGDDADMASVPEPESLAAINSDDFVGHAPPNFQLRGQVRRACSALSG